MIKTLTLDGLTSVTVKESPFDMARFCWVRNRTEADVYISCTDPQCTPNADGVKCISAGECGMLDSESLETLYISGSGVVNIETTPFLVCPFNRDGKGGGSYELPIATTEILGGVIPDGTTITVDENGVISAVGRSDDWTYIGSATVSHDSSAIKFSIPDLSNYKFMMMSISTNTSSSSLSDSSFNFTRIFILDDLKYSDIYSNITYMIGDDANNSSSPSTTYPYIGQMTVSKTSDVISLTARITYKANIYMK